MLASPCTYANLRVYPPAFARTVCDLVEKMKENCLGQPEIVGKAPPAIETMQRDWECEKSLWQFVDFNQVFVYLRGSTKVSIPEIWKPIIPRKLS